MITSLGVILSELFMMDGYYEAKRKEWQFKSRAAGRVKTLESETAALRDQVKILAARVREQHAQYVEREEAVERLREVAGSEIATFDNGSYTPKFRALIYKLLSRNIAHELS